MRTLGACLFASGLTTGSALAGGSSAPVRVLSLEAKNATDYVTVLDVVGDSSPLPAGAGNCSRVEIHGTFGALKSKGHLGWLKDLLSPPSHDRLTKDGHSRALQYLKDAVASRETINVGYMGTGFVPITPTDPCVVGSRALELHAAPDGIAVISHFYDH